MTARTTELRVDGTLRMIIVGFREVAAVWITVLAIIAVVGNDAPDCGGRRSSGTRLGGTGLTVIEARRGFIDHLAC